jgi:DNA-binding response OmpR family regulator
MVDAVADDGARPRVLVVDDDSALRDLLTDILRDHGYTPASTARGSETLRLTRRFRPNLILLDAHLPDLDGPEVVRQLRADSEASLIPILMYTAYPRESAEWREAELLGVPMLAKPFDLGDLIERVQALLPST